MGSFYTSVQVKSKNHLGVVAALKSSRALPAYVSQSSEDGWISVFPSATETQDYRTLKSVAAKISETTKAAAFGLLVHDSDVFYYVLFENGILRDEYNSDPGYFDGQDLQPTGGDVSVLEKYCIEGTTPDELVQVFHSRRSRKKAGAVSSILKLVPKDGSAPADWQGVFRGDTLAAKFGEKLGIDSSLISAGYNYIDEEPEEYPSVNLIP